MHLLKIVQTIFFCKKAKPDKVLIREINIDSIDFETLKVIVPPKKRDS